MRTIKTSLKAIVLGLILVSIFIVLDDNGYGFFGFMDFARSFLNL